MIDNNNDKNKNRKKVLIAYKFMPQYRVDFFNQLKIELDRQNIDLQVVYGKSINVNRKDEIDLDWGIYRKNQILSFSKFTIYWQPITDIIKGQDLVIVEQANSLLINYYLILLRTFGKIKLGFWGHGRNRQGKQKSFINAFKKFILNKCDYWFAYTKSVEEYLLLNGVNESKISVVNNCFDTTHLVTLHNSITQFEVEETQKELGITPEDHVAIYCGALYKEKRIDFLLDATKLIRQKDDKFQLIILGNGPDKKKVDDFAKQNNWIHPIGSKFNREKSKYFKLVKICLMPGALGLAALDAIAMKTPMVIPHLDIHGPEIDYLVHNVNAILTADNSIDFAEKSIELFQNPTILDKLITGCSISTEEITLEKMVASFTEGVIKCLNE